MLLSIIKCLAVLLLDISFWEKSVTLGGKCFASIFKSHSDFLLINYFIAFTAVNHDVGSMPRENLLRKSVLDICVVR